MQVGGHNSSFRRFPCDCSGYVLPRVTCTVGGDHLARVIYGFDIFAEDLGSAYKAIVVKDSCVYIAGL